MTTLSTHESAVNSLYLAFYGRPADPAGLKFWAGHLANSDGDHRAIIDAFATSREAQLRFGDDTPAERIAEIYQQLFNRTPEQSGVDYWAEVVAQGHASLADVAVEILKGAQGTDKGLLDLRQQAVDAFTTLVETSGSDYAGYSSIEAARVLVRAVTSGASQADIEQLVKATVAFADIASHNPAVIDAIATGSNLLALFDTARGKADPVVLAQALADVAQAAAGSPATLESLLRGGGMAQVLKVMPASATLQDVVNALAQGGLTAAIDVVYPPGPTPTPTPPKGVTFTFEGVTHDPDDRAPNDHVTNETTVDIRFSVSGALQPGQKIQYRHEGSAEWTDIAPVNGIIVLEDVDLTMGEPVGEYRAGAREPMPDHLLTVELRVAAPSGGTVGTPFKQEILLDVTDPHGQLGFVRIGQGVDGVLKTDDEIVEVTFSIDDTSDGVVQWRIKGAETWVDAPQANSTGTFTLQGIDLSEADQTIELRVIDAAGNVGDYQEWDIDGPASADLTVTPTLDGLTITSPIAGSLALGPSPLFSTEQGGGAIKGSFYVGQQQSQSSGTLQVTPVGGGTPVADASGRSYFLGTTSGDMMSGATHQWGFDGDDLLIGTAGDDYLIGGDGYDEIVGGGGSDFIAGGSGADTIIMLADGKASRLLYEAGDTHIGGIVSGDKIPELDRIVGAEVGDVFHIGTIFRDTPPEVSDELLSGYLLGATALARGSNINGRFLHDASGEDYMLQWTDGNGINSILLAGYSGPDLALKIDAVAGTLTLAAAPVPPGEMASIHTGTQFDFSAQWSKFSFSGIPADVVLANTGNGLLDASGLQLTDLRPGADPTSGYLDGSNFGVDIEGRLTLNKVLVAGVYELKWTEGTFATEVGVFGAGSTRFAGGVDGTVVQQGFELKGAISLDGRLVNASGSANSMLYEPGNASTVLITGKGHDAVLAGHGTVDLHYERFDSASHDLIVRFGDDDHITLAGQAATKVNKDFSDEIVWKTGAEVVVDGATEGVFIETLGPFVSDELNLAGSATLLNLNNHLNVTGAQKDDSALILVKALEGRGGALLHYTSADNNGVVDANEVTLIAVFTQGVPEISQITLIGIPG
ncbi:DUF4214 domain-containing protein [Massilia sp. CFBP9012]|uniref:DUF4214 domain-containing protein n=1 Tax=Massilia sp. CFBP9012 TaxID=3096531 RepID=UPI002A6B082C|nr:DUF4214 domain-containing protein [Massilia sp. CFBP9012]MDY0978184.1 DUF4214 domain-containing protein [Massilia sp. CFBP9012]